MNIAAMALAIGLVMSPAAAAHPAISVAHLDGAQETGAGDPNGHGTAVVWLDPDTGLLCYLVTAVKLDGAVTAAHIHKATAGSNGPVVVGLSAPVDHVAKACINIAPTLAADLAASPANYYVNVHTSLYPASAVRGQLG